MNDLKWFTGVVEDVNDPQERGRIKVRAIGYHTPDSEELPTASLPWATPLMPVTSASISGIGQTSTGLLPGSWVMGFFRDGDDHQDPIIVGSIPGNSTRVQPGSTFADPSSVYPKRNGVDTPEIATNRYNKSTGYNIQQQTDHQTIELAVAPAIKSIDPTSEDATRGSFTPPSTLDSVKPSYPYNSATRTVSGHVIEVDDTPGAERLSETHCSGTMRQIDSGGNLNTTIVGASYKIVAKDDNVYVYGACNLTIVGDCNTLIRGNYNLEVEGNYNENIKGSKIIKTGADYNAEIYGKVTQNIGGERQITIGTNDSMIVSGISKIDCRKLDFTSTDTSFKTLGPRVDFTSGNMDNSAGGTMSIGAASVTTITGSSINLNP